LGDFAPFSFRRQPRLRVVGQLAPRQI
jgi:hypothetical protein